MRICCVGLSCNQGSQKASVLIGFSIHLHNYKKKHQHRCSRSTQRRHNCDIHSRAGSLTSLNCVPSISVDPSPSFAALWCRVMRFTPKQSFPLRRAQIGHCDLSPPPTTAVLNDCSQEDDNQRYSGKLEGWMGGWGRAKREVPALRKCNIKSHVSQDFLSVVSSLCSGYLQA